MLCRTRQGKHGKCVGWLITTKTPRGHSWENPEITSGDILRPGSSGSPKGHCRQRKDLRIWLLKPRGQGKVMSFSKEDEGQPNIIHTGISVDKQACKPLDQFIRTQ